MVCSLGDSLEGIVDAVRHKKIKLEHLPFTLAGNQAFNTTGTGALVVGAGWLGVGDSEGVGDGDELVPLTGCTRTRSTFRPLNPLERKAVKETWRVLRA